MYPVSNEVKALFEAENAQVLRITGTDRNGTAISITDANVMLGGFNIDRYSCNGEKLEVGTAIAAEMELACVILPIPKDANTTNRAKRNASVRPANLFFMP